MFPKSIRTSFLIVLNSISIKKKLSTQLLHEEKKGDDQLDIVLTKKVFFLKKNLMQTERKNIYMVQGLNY